MYDFDDIAVRGLGRRDFLVKLGVGTAGLALFSVGCSSSDDNSGLTNSGGNGTSGSTGTVSNAGTTGSTSTSAFFDPSNFPNVPGKSENTVVLNYALTLELLESDLFRQALNLASGRAIGTALDSTPGGYTLAISDGGLGAKAPYGYRILLENAFKEQAHASFLKTAIVALGDTPVTPRPTGYKANFGSTLQSILTVTRSLEEEGTRAYLGAGPYLTDLGLLQAAATIYTTEARHAAAYAYILGVDTGPAPMNNDQLVTPNYPHVNTFEYFRTPTQVMQDIQPFLA